TAEPYRSYARRVLASAVRRPDPEGARARLGCAAVRSEVDDLVQSFADVDEAWASLFTHGARLFLDALPPDVLEDVKNDFAREVGETSVELHSEFHYWCFTK